MKTKSNRVMLHKDSVNLRVQAVVRLTSKLKAQRLNETPFCVPGSTHLIKEYTLNSSGMLAMVLGDGREMVVQKLRENPNSVVTFNNGRKYHHFINMEGPTFARLQGRHVYVEEVTITAINKWYQLRVLPLAN
jgi:hypothetical protein